MEIRGLPAVTHDVRCREREFLPKAIGQSQHSQWPPNFDHTFRIPRSSWVFSERWVTAVMTTGGAETGRRWPLTSDGLEDTDAGGQDFFQPGAVVIAGRLGTRHDFPGRVGTVLAAGDLEHWFRNLCPAVVFLKEGWGVGRGEGGGSEKEEEDWGKTQEKKTKITSFVYAKRRGILLTERGWIIKIIIDMKVHWKLRFFFFLNGNDRMIPLSSSLIEWKFYPILYPNYRQWLSLLKDFFFFLIQSISLILQFTLWVWITGCVMIKLQLKIPVSEIAADLHWGPVFQRMSLVRTFQFLWCRLVRVTQWLRSQQPSQKACVHSFNRYW